MSQVDEAKAPVVSARIAGLRYVNDDGPGIRRIRSGSGFRYLAPNGRSLRDPEMLARIKSLAIPPAYRDVWICPDPRGHIQATARDARGRKQYRYHPGWREVRDSVKFARMVALAQALPRIRELVDRDLELPGLPKQKVLAAVVRLLERTHIRVGNEEYTRQNKSFGLTTLRNRHMLIVGDSVRFRFRGKGQKEHIVRVTDRRLARLLKKCSELPGCELFSYLDEAGESKVIDSGDVNDYLRELAGQEFTAKDFRTWAATVSAAAILRKTEPGSTARETKQRILEMLARTSAELGNTPAVCRKSYIHPAVLESYESGALHRFLRFAQKRRRSSVGRTRRGGGSSTRAQSAAVVLEADADFDYALGEDEELVLRLLLAAPLR